MSALSVLFGKQLKRRKLIFIPKGDVSQCLILGNTVEKLLA